MLRRIHDPERGAGYIEYAATVLLIAAIVTAVGTVGIPGRTTALINESLRQIATTTPAEGDNQDPDRESDPTNEQIPDSGTGTDPTGTGPEPPNSDTGGGSGSEGTGSTDSQDGQDDNGGPLSFLPDIDTADLNPLAPTQTDPLGLGGLMPGQPEAHRLQLAYGPNDLLEDSRDIADRAKNTAIQRGKDAWDNTRQLFTTNIGDTITATAHGLYTDIEDSAKKTAERYGQEWQHGNKLKAGAGIAFDAAFYYAFDSPIATSVNPTPALILNQDRRDEYAHGHWVEALTNTAIDAGPMLIPGPKIKIPGLRGTNTPSTQPDTGPQHLADGPQAPTGRGDGRENNNSDGNSNSKGDKGKDKDNNGDRDSPCARNSFPPGTPVLMADGTTTAIEDITAGEKVWAFDPATGQEGPHEVTHTITGAGHKTLVDITVTDPHGGTSDVLTATDGHPFWAPQQAQWVDAADLQPGTWLRTSTGTWTQISAVEAYTAAHQQVHNLTVEGLHTYYVGTGADSVLVHNDDCIPGPQRGIEENGLKHSFDRHAKEWFGGNPTMKTHGDQWRDLIEMGMNSTKVVEWKTGSTPTYGHLTRVDGKYFFVQFSRENGNLVTAFRPSNRQLTSILDKLKS